jgi:hypothetical protein
MEKINMTTNLTVQQLTQAAQDYHKQLSSLENKISRLDSKTQLTELENAFTAQSATLQELRNKIENAFARVETFNPQDCDKIMGSLGKSHEILENFRKNHEFLVDLFLLKAEMQEASQNQNKTNIVSLQSRVNQLSDNCSTINPMNVDTFFSFQDALNRLTIEPSLSSNNNAQENPMKEQFIKLVKDFETLKTSLTKDPMNDFEQVISFYQTAKTFCSHPSSHTFEKAVEKIGDFLTEIENLLNQIVSVQQAIESQIVNQAPLLNPAFNELLNLITDFMTAQTQNEKGSLFNANKQIQPTFNKLNDVEKKLLLSAFSEVLKNAKKITMDYPVSQSAQAFALWGSLNNATWIDRKKALEKVIEDASKSSLSNLASVSMQKRIQDVKNMHQMTIN